MITVLAYILTLVLSQFAFTIGSFIVIGILSFVFIFLPSETRAPFVSFIAHVMGILLAIGFGYLVFWLLNIKFYWIPGFAVIISALIPVWGDFKEYVRVRKANKAVGYTVDLIIKEAAIVDSGYAGMVVGDVTGIIIGAAWLLLR